MGHTKSYTFVDYATQAYLGLVALMILVFHNATVPHWGALVAIHVAVIASIHCLVACRKRAPQGRLFRLLDFVRHFYPVALYAFLYAETGWLNRSSALRSPAHAICLVAAIRLI